MNGRNYHASGNTLNRAVGGASVTLQRPLNQRLWNVMQYQWRCWSLLVVTYFHRFLHQMPDTLAVICILRPLLTPLQKSESRIFRNKADRSDLPCLKF